LVSIVMDAENVTPLSKQFSALMSSNGVAVNAVN
jgi:hypothetical protein